MSLIQYRYRKPKITIHRFNVIIFFVLCITKTVSSLLRVGSIHCIPLKRDNENALIIMGNIMNHG